MKTFGDSGPQMTLLPDGRRLHLHHGPIDLIVEAVGSAKEVTAAYRQAQDAFAPVLDALVLELSLLRAPLDKIHRVAGGAVAGRMLRAVGPHTGVFVTPMAAVAGAVADHILDRLLKGRCLRRAYVNNGGDIALYLAPGERFVLGAMHMEKVTIHSTDKVRGIATSGWRGRSHSLGIADAVTVLARSAAAADVAATLIASAVDLPGSSLIQRQAACELSPDSDLGNRPVTIGVGALSETDKTRALERGAKVAREMRRQDLILAASLSLQGQTRCVDRPGPIFHISNTKRLIHA